MDTSQSHQQHTRMDSQILFDPKLIVVVGLLNPYFRFVDTDFHSQSSFILLLNPILRIYISNTRWFTVVLHLFATIGISIIVFSVNLSSRHAIIVFRYYNFPFVAILVNDIINHLIIIINHPINYFDKLTLFSFDSIVLDFITQIEIS